jgi:DNA/RNA endonuclease G (NUC1)
MPNVLTQWRRLVALLFLVVSITALADVPPRAVPFASAESACGWSPDSPAGRLLRSADAAASQDGQTSALELRAFAGKAQPRVPDQAIAAAASCVASITGEPDELAPRGGPAELVRATRWGYRFAFDRARGASLWAAHLLTAADLQTRAGLSRSGERFAPEPVLGAGGPVPDDYRNTGFDRGHLQPAGDTADELAMSQSFLMGNVVPQHKEMNERAWEFLESALRDLVTATGGQAWVVTGALFLQPDARSPLAAGQERRLPGRTALAVTLGPDFSAGRRRW